MKKNKNNLLLIALSLYFINVLQSQDSSFIILPTIHSNYPNIEISGLISNKTELCSNPLDTAKLKIFAEDKPCSLLSIKENYDTLNIHILFEENDFLEKTDRLIQTINKLNANCIATIKPVWHLIRNTSIINKQEGSIVTYNDSLAKFIFIDTLAFDFTTISDFINRLSKSSPQTKHLTLLYSNEESNDILSIYTRIANSEKHNNVFFSYISFSKNQFKPFVFFENIYSNSKTFVKTKIFKSQDEDILIDSSLGHYQIDQESISSDLCKMLNCISNRHLVIEFSTDNTEALADSVHYRVIYKWGNQHLTNSFTVKKTNQSIGKNSLPSQIITLNNDYKKKPSDSLKNLSRELIIEYSKSSEIIANPDSIFFISEEVWDFSPQKDNWYRDMKTDLLVNSLSSKSTPDERLLVINELILLQPDDKEYKLKKLKIAGDNYSQNKEYKNAVSAYSGYLELEDDSSISEMLKLNLEIAFEVYFNNRDYTNLYILGKSNSEHFRTSFKMRYYYAQACYFAKDYKLSLQNYRWLIDNWDNNQKHLNWNDAMLKLEKLYTYNYNFDESLKLNRKIYRDTKNEAALDSYLINLRVKHLILIADAFSAFLINSKSRNKIKQLSSNIPKPSLVCINSIYLQNTKTGNISQIIKYSNLSIPPKRSLENIKTYPAIITSNNNEIGWIVNRKEDNLIIVDFSITPVNIEENNLIIEIRNNRDMVEPWGNLANYETQHLLKYCTGVLAGMISFELDIGFTGNINKYWNAVHENSKLEFMLKYNKQGKITQNKSFIFDKATVNNTLWSKSKKTKTFFEQEISYNNKSIIVISNPLYNNYTWSGVLEIGFPD
jgi:hypothetical protein